MSHNTCGNCKHIMQSQNSACMQCYCGKAKEDDWGNLKAIDDIDVVPAWCPKKK